MNIYEIEAEFRHLQEALENQEIPDEVYADMIDCMDFELEAKADGYAKVIRNMESSINSLAAEANLLNTKKKTLETRVDKLKSTLLTALLNIKGEKVQGEIFGFAVRNSERVEVPDIRRFFEAMEANPEDKQLYVTVKHTETPNKTEIKKAIKNGAEIPGAVIVQNKTLQVKVG